MQTHEEGAPDHPSEPNALSKTVSIRNGDEERQLRANRAFATASVLWLVASVVAVVFGFVTVSSEVVSDRNLLFSVFMCGAGGAAVGAAVTLAALIGRAQYQSAWTAYFLLRPVIGGGLSTVLYVVVRGVFLSGNASAHDINFYGVVGASFLVGLGSKGALERLAGIYDALLERGYGATLARRTGVDDSFGPRVTPLDRYRGYLIHSASSTPQGWIISAWLQDSPHPNHSSQLIDIGSGRPTANVRFRAVVIAHDAVMVDPESGDIIANSRHDQKSEPLQFRFEGTESQPHAVIEISQRGRTVAVINVGENGQ